MIRSESKTFKRSRRQMQLYLGIETTFESDNNSASDN